MIKGIIENNMKISKEMMQNENAVSIINSLVDSNGNFNLAYLKEKIPKELIEVFEKSIDKDKFKSLIKEYKEKVESEDDIVIKNIIDESYELNFLGKSLGKILASQQSTTIFVPDDKNDEEINKNSKNIYITADNLEALRHLRNSYSGKIKCIYIDPPYNTGTDGFCYPDNFGYDVETIKTKFGVDDSTAVAIMEMTSNSSNSHNAWLSFMYPRLLLAKELLSEEGIIFISIDDNEQANAKLLCDKIFDESNFIGTLIQQRAKGGGQAKYIVKGHDYILVYANELNENISLSRKKRIQGTTVNYNGVECIRNDDVVRKKYGKYDKNDGDRRCYYEQLVEYKGQKKKEEIDKLIEDGKYVLEKNDEGMHTIVEYIPVEESRSKLYSIIKDLSEPETIIKALSEKGKEDIEKLDIPFSYPKPKILLKELFGAISTNENDIFMDFFSGSSTSADAILNINADDEKSIQYIMIQIAEDLDKALERASEEAKIIIKSQIELCDKLKESRIIPTIAMERIRRVAKNIKEETGADIDYGFKHYTLVDKGNTIDKIEKFDPNVLNINYDIMENFDAKSLLITYACDDGFGLNPYIEEIDLGGYTAYRVENKDWTEEVALYLLDKGFEDEQNKKLIEISNERNLNISKIIVFGYAFSARELQILKANISQIGIKFDESNKRIDPIIRY